MEVVFVLHSWWYDISNGKGLKVKPTKQLLDFFASTILIMSKKIYIRFSTLFAELLNRFLVCPHVIELFFDGKLYVGRKQEHEIWRYYGHNGWHAT